MKNELLIKKLLIVFLLVSQVFCWIFLHSSVISRSLILSEMESKISELEKKNEDLKREIATFSSIASIKERATRLGLVRAEKIVVLRDQERFAYRD